MRFSSSLFGLLSLAVASVSALPLHRRETSPKFGVMTLRSASPIHFLLLTTKNSDGSIYVGGSGDDATFQIEDGVLKTIFGSGLESFVYIDPKTYEVKYRASLPEGALSKTWDIADSYLEFDGEENAIACPSDGGYKLYWAAKGSNANICGVGVTGLGAGTMAINAVSSSAAVESSTAVATSTSLPATTTSAAVSRPASDPFSVVSVHSGSEIQYLGLASDGKGNLYFSSPSYVTHYVTNYIDGNGDLRIYGTDDYVYVNNTNGKLEYAASLPTSGVTSRTWSLQGSSLQLNQLSSAVACKVDDLYEAYWVLGSNFDICPGHTEGIGADLYYTYVSPTSSAAVASATAVSSSSSSSASSSAAITSTAAPVTTSSTSTTKTTSAATSTKSSAPAATVSLLPPNLLIPAKEATPDQVYGAQYTGLVTSAKDIEVSTFVSFDIPELKDSAKTCELIWTPPSAASFPSVITGTKKVDVYAVEGINESTLSWSDKPTRGKFIGTFDASTGAFNGSTVSCEFGEKQQFELVAHGESEVSWFQTFEPLTGFNYVLLA
ncbi:ubiquitin 3 binding protein But2 C-terminal domain-containing protein [Lipomyces arxii]|uniref:ubiquitin 3 binding protein But2 C-terminal domain-containing protein n=1 Tax=Lipomyces arxii TaxID=56418 RepID=UPI0034CDC797